VILITIENVETVVKVDVITTATIETTEIVTITVDVVTIGGGIHFIFIFKALNWEAKEVFFPPNTTPTLGGLEK